MKQIINWGIIGLGNIALQFAKAFKDSTNSKLKGISSTNFEKIKAFQKKFEINKEYCFSNYQDLLKNALEGDANFFSQPSEVDPVEICI